MSVEELKRALMGKVADAPKNNENDTLIGTGNVQPPPAGRKPGTVDAKWGDPPPPPETYGSSVKREAQNDRGDLLDRILDSPRTSAPAEQSLMQQYFATRDGHPHAPLLQRGRERAGDDDGTLTDQVRRVVGSK
jgi:hypothetical protein